MGAGLSRPVPVPEAYPETFRTIPSCKMQCRFQQVQLHQCAGEEDRTNVIIHRLQDSELSVAREKWWERRNSLACEFGFSEVAGASLWETECWARRAFGLIQEELFMLLRLFVQLHFSIDLRNGQPSLHFPNNVLATCIKFISRNDNS